MLRRAMGGRGLCQMARSASADRLAALHTNYASKPKYLPEELIGAFNAISSCFQVPRQQVRLLIALSGLQSHLRIALARVPTARRQDRIHRRSHAEGSLLRFHAGAGFETALLKPPSSGWSCDATSANPFPGLERKDCGKAQARDRFFTSQHLRTAHRSAARALQGARSVQTHAAAAAAAAAFQSSSDADEQRRYERDLDYKARISFLMEALVWVVPPLLVFGLPMLLGTSTDSLGAALDAVQQMRGTGSKPWLQWAVSVLLWIAKLALSTAASVFLRYEVLESQVLPLWSRA